MTTLHKIRNLYKNWMSDVITNGEFFKQIDKLLFKPVKGEAYFTSPIFKEDKPVKEEGCGCTKDSFCFKHLKQAIAGNHNDFLSPSKEIKPPVNSKEKECSCGYHEVCDICQKTTPSKRVEPIEKIETYQEHTQLLPYTAPSYWDAVTSKLNELISHITALEER